MDMKDIIRRLEEKGVRPTANRILVYKTLTDQTSPLSLGDLERLISTMDKSSISRALTLFLANDVVHNFEDGRGVMNYEPCEEEGHCDHHDGHIHFYCETCRRSFCLDTIHMPSLSLPAGFTPRSSSFVIKGECPACSEKRKRH